MISPKISTYAALVVLCLVLLWFKIILDRPNRFGLMQFVLEGCNLFWTGPLDLLHVIGHVQKDLDLSKTNVNCPQDSPLQFWCFIDLIDFFSTKVKCSYGVYKFKTSRQNFFTLRGKAINTKREQMWNFSGDWIWIWVRRNCTLV